MFLNGLLTAAGLAALIAGAEALVRGSSRLAAILGMKPILIGLTIVAFGTSAPEAVVSIFAAIQSKADIAVGNIVGSNIFNIAFILGLSALIYPLKVEMNSLRREIPFVVLSAVLVWLLGRDGVLGRLDGLLFLGLFCFFLWICFRRTGNGPLSADKPEGKKGIQILWISFGLFFLMIGSKFFIQGAVGISRSLGVSELVIGLTLVAAGTSLPELATSTLSAWRKESDIAVGNITGSNIFNILFILGISALIHPLPIGPALLGRDIPVMLLVSLAAVPILKTGFVISRLEGAFLLTGYLIYLISLCR